MTLAADRAERAGQHLAVLRAELARRGVASQVITSGCWPRLVVDTEWTGTGKADAVFEDTIVAAPCPAGHWCFWWPWVEQIGPAGDVRAAASVITGALVCADGGAEDGGAAGGGDARGQAGGDRLRGRWRRGGGPGDLAGALAALGIRRFRARVR